MPRQIDANSGHAERMGKLSRQCAPGIEVCSGFVQQKNGIGAAAPSVASDDLTPRKDEFYGVELRHRTYAPQSLCL